MAGPEARRYRAFVSYSHRDRKAGDRPFAYLDGYRPPKPLVGRETPLGPVPAKLYPIFRDREELTASPALAGRLEAALAASDHLVVICSPQQGNENFVRYGGTAGVRIGLQPLALDPRSGAAYDTLQVGGRSHPAVGR